MKRKIKFPDQNFSSFLLCFFLLFSFNCSNESEKTTSSLIDLDSKSSETKSESTPNTEPNNNNKEKTNDVTKSPDSAQKIKVCLAACETLNDCCPLSIQKWGDCNSYTQSMECKNSVCSIIKCDNKSFCEKAYNQTDYFRGYDCAKSGYCLPACKEDLDCCPSSLDRSSPECSKFTLGMKCNKGVCESRKCSLKIDCQKRYNENYDCDKSSGVCYPICSSSLDCCSGDNDCSKKFSCEKGLCKNLNCQDKTSCENLYGDEVYEKGWLCSDQY